MMRQILSGLTPKSMILLSQGLALVFFLMLALQFVQTIKTIYHLVYSVETPIIIPFSKPVNVFDENNLQTALFGTYLPVRFDDNAIKRSVLNIDIVGIMYAQPHTDSTVLLRLPNGEEKEFKLGDVLPGGGEIKKIENNGIIIERSGDLESIMLPRNELQFEPLPKPLIKE